MTSIKIRKSITIDWDSLNWEQISQQVFCMQQKIWLASISGHYSLLRKIQTEAFNSLNFKMLSVKYVTSKNFIQEIAGIKYKTYIPNHYKVELVKKLVINNKAINLINTNIDHQTLPLIIQDSALQFLIKLVLEPEWAGKSENHVFSSRPGIRLPDLIEKVVQYSQSVYGYRYVISGHITKKKSKLNINHLQKTTKYSGALIKQLAAWTDADCLSANQLLSKQFPKNQKSVIGNLILDMFLYGLEWFLYESYQVDYKSSLTNRSLDGNMPFQILRISDQVIILVNNLSLLFDIVSTANKFLYESNMVINYESIHICNIYQGFDFLGFHIKRLKHDDQLYVLPSRASIDFHLNLLKSIIYHEYEGKTRATTNKSLDEVISQMNPIIKDWCLYYKDFVHSNIFRSIDWKLSNTIYRWFKKKVKSVNTLAKWKSSCQIILNNRQRIGTGFDNVLILHSDFKPSIYNKEKNYNSYLKDIQYWQQK